MLGLGSVQPKKCVVLRPSARVESKNTVIVDQTEADGAQEGHTHRRERERGMEEEEEMGV